jgi:hypothetical protein
LLYTLDCPAIDGVRVLPEALALIADSDYDMGSIFNFVLDLG